MFCQEVLKDCSRHYTLTILTMAFSVYGSSPPMSLIVLVFILETLI